MPRLVTFHYTLRDPSSRVLDTSAGGNPITFIEGAGQIIEGLEERLRTAGAGEKLHVQVAAAKAYGAHDPAQVQPVHRGLLPIEGDLKVGDSFRVGEDPYAPFVRVAGIQGENVILDANHPLAGVDLAFEVEVLVARDASAEELRQAFGEQAPDAD